MTTVLIVDDEPGVLSVLEEAMHRQGYQTTLAANGAEALDQARRLKPDLCIVDINLPVMSGFDFLEKLRRDDQHTPVLLLSARDSEEDVTKGLRYGADDYVRKPFGVDEISLRVAAILRRAHPTGQGDIVLRCGALTLNVDKHEVWLGDELIDLSATEFRLLEVLLERIGRVVTREQLLREVWNIDFDSETSVLDTYVSYVRKKVHRDDFAPITTVRGVGFKVVVPESKS